MLLSVYDKVYIYEFEGDMTHRVASLIDDDYIGFWREGDYSFLFFGRTRAERFRSLSLAYRSELVINHEDWESGRPLDIMRAGRLSVHPPWKTPSPGDGVPVCIDPNMAFGSGHHPSTKGCLLLLDRLFMRSAPRRVLDLGTGTGVLSIACLRMGCRTAVSIDNNNLAVEVAKRNRELNGVRDAMHIVMGKAADFLHLDADLLIANMHFAAIDPLTGLDDFYNKKYCLVSGLIRNEGLLISERVQKRMTLADSYSENFWFSYLFENR